MAPLSPHEQRKLALSRRRQAEAHAWLASQPRLEFSRVDESSRFSLRTLLAMMTVASIMFAVGRWFDPPMFAALCGVIAVFYPLCIPRDREYTPLLQQFWWLLLAVYLLAVVGAMGAQR